MTVSKQDGEIKEIPISYKEKKPIVVTETDANGMVINDMLIRNRGLIPFQNSWILVEPSADTIYRYSPNHTMEPFIVRTPSVQLMSPEVFLFPGVITDRYYFMQTVKREFNFDTNTGLPRTDLMYDRHDNAIFECVVYNDDFINKRPVNLVYEIFTLTLMNSEIAFTQKLEAFDLVEAYKNGQLKGKLKEIAATLDEESNPVIMIVKHKK